LNSYEHVCFGFQVPPRRVKRGLACRGKSEGKALRRDVRDPFRTRKRGGGDCTGLIKAMKARTSAREGRTRHVPANAQGRRRRSEDLGDHAEKRLI